MVLATTSAPTPGRTLWVAAHVGLLLLAIYAPALGGKFLWNDRDYVTRPDLRSWAGLERIWTEPGATEQYYPLLHSAFWLEDRSWGQEPFGYHVVNVLAHGLACVLFWRLLRQLDVPGAGLAAILFAIHPVHVQSVAWIAEQKNTLSTVLFLAAATLYLHFDATRLRRAYWTAFAIFVLALLTKTMTATLPAALLVVLWWKRGRLELRRDVGPLVPWIALSLAAAILATWVEARFVGARGENFALTTIQRVLIAGRVPWHYAGHVVWPEGLNFIYARWVPRPDRVGDYLPLAGCLALVVGAWRWRRRSRAPLALLLLFLGTLTPVLGFVNLYGSLYSWVWDHWQYLPDLVLCSALGPIGWSLHSLSPSRLRPVVTGAALATGISLAVLAGLRATDFRDEETLYRRTLARNPDAWMAHNNLGNLLAEKPEQRDEARQHFEEALRLRPEHANAHVNLGNLLARNPADLAEAKIHFAAALRLKPDYAEAHNYLAAALAREPGGEEEAASHYREALRLKPDYAEAHANYAMLLGTHPETPTEAEDHFREALRLRPNFAEAHCNYALFLLRQGRLAESRTHLQTAIRLNPALAEAYNNLGNLLAAEPGSDAAAEAAYRDAVRLKPGYVEARNNLGRFLATKPGREKDAINELEAALALDPQLASAHVNLANALVRAGGREADAIRHYDAAVRLGFVSAQLERNLALLYARAGQPAAALPHAERAAALDPASAEARQLLELLRGH